MKTCPICKSVAFDDAGTCYGCLYDFGKGEDDSAVDPMAQKLVADSNVAQSDGSSVSFVITLTPEGRISNEISWRCAVEAVVI